MPLGTRSYLLNSLIHHFGSLIRIYLLAYDTLALTGCCKMQHLLALLVHPNHCLSQLQILLSLGLDKCRSNITQTTRLRWLKNSIYCNSCQNLNVSNRPRHRAKVLWEFLIPNFHPAFQRNLVIFIGSLRAIIRCHSWVQFQVTRVTFRAILKAFTVPSLSRSHCLF